MTKLKPKHKFYTSAGHLLSRKGTVEDIQELAKEFDITPEQVQEYLKTITISKAVSGALMAGKEEKEALFNMLDQKFIEQYNNIVVFRRGENLYFHEYKDGYYQKVFDRDMYNYVDSLMCQYSLFDYRTSERRVKDTIARIASHLSRIPKRYFSEESNLWQKWQLNLKNGLLDLETFTLSPHTPDFFSTVQVPYDFEPNADCPEFKEFIKQVSNQTETTATMIQEMFGYCILEGNPKHRVFYLYGDTARNGKSTTAKVICGLIGWGNVSTLSLQQIASENSSILTSIIGKQINFSDEISSKFIESSRLTAMSAEGIVEINPKYKDSFLHTVKAKFIIACNDLPRFKDSQGMKHRMISIPFRYQFKESERVDRLDELLLKKEGSGILNWAIAGAMQLKKLGKFSVNEESQDDMYENLLQSNSVYAYLEMNFKFDDTYDMPMHPKELFGEKPTTNEKGSGYRLFCNAMAINETSYFTFCRELKRFSRETGKMKQDRGNSEGKRNYVGLRRINSDDIDAEEEAEKIYNDINK